MSIQTAGFPLVLQADDFQRTDFGIKWGIKLQRIAGFGDIVYVTWFDRDGKQNVEALDDGFDVHILNYGNDVTRWLKEYLIPKMNLWLSRMFKAGDNTVPTAPDLFQQAHTAVGKIVITVNTDGTLKASA
jgi:hypothetical protein